MHFKSLNFITMLAMALALAACAPHSKRKENPEETIVFVKGDPSLFVAGAQFDSASPLREENVSQLNSFVQISSYKIVERVTLKKSEARPHNIIEENRTGDFTKRAAGAVTTYKSTEDKDLWLLWLSDSNIGFALRKNAEGQLDVEQVGDSKEVYDAKILHWSATPDDRYRSLLIKVEGSGNRYLQAFYFQRLGPWSDVPKVSEDFIYLLGPGRQLGWKIPAQKSLDIELCGSTSFTDVARESVEVWRPILKDRLDVKFSQTDTYPPFSDLNHHCIYTVNSYFEKPFVGELNYGNTYPIMSISNLELVDADIFIMMAEINKLHTLEELNWIEQGSAERKIERVLPRAFRHEIGHLLGLGHKFDKAHTPSVMSYDDYIVPQPYDIEALQALYPLRDDVPTTTP